MSDADIRSDGELYSDYLSGDNRSYDQLMIRYGDSLTLFLYGYLHDWQDSEDLMIEAFARIMVKRPRIGDDSFKAYLYKTARNLAARFHMRKSRFTQFSFDEYGEWSSAPGLVTDTSADDEGRRVLHLCLERIDEIDPQLREALWLVYYEGMTYREAAQIMKVTVRRIDHLLERGKRVMRAELEKEGVTGANG